MKTTVGALATAEARQLAPLPPAFPATVAVTRVVSSQALVAFRGNHYSVPPGLAGATVTVSHRLGVATLDIAVHRPTPHPPSPTGTVTATVLARHRREPDGAGVMVRDTVHVTAYADPRTGWVVALAALDNLTKGASGGALQSANVALGFGETTGLPVAGLYP